MNLENTKLPVRAGWRSVGLSLGSTASTLRWKTSKASATILMLTRHCFYFAVSRLFQLPLLLVASDGRCACYQLKFCVAILAFEGWYWLTLVIFVCTFDQILRLQWAVHRMLMMRTMIWSCTMTPNMMWLTIPCLTSLAVTRRLSQWGKFQQYTQCKGCILNINIVWARTIDKRGGSSMLLLIKVTISYMKPVFWSCTYYYDAHVMILSCRPWQFAKCTSRNYCSLYSNWPRSRWLHGM
jgi:hypothetical protein